MLKILLPFLLMFQPQPENKITGKDILKKMYDRYHNHWYQNFTFDQDTKQYRNDSLIKTSLWHEAMIFPAKFRIDFGAKDSGNAVIFRNDSSYRFKNGLLKAVSFDDDNLQFLLGGMYYNPLLTVLEKIKKFGYDISKGHEAYWKGHAVLVIGAEKGEENINQIWIDADKLIIVRLLTFKDNQKEEAIFGDHIKLGGGYTETSCLFYINNKLIQEERYHHCRENKALDPRFFEPKYFGKYYWFQ